MAASPWDKPLTWWLAQPILTFRSISLSKCIYVCKLIFAHRLISLQNVSNTNILEESTTQGLSAASLFERKKVKITVLAWRVSSINNQWETESTYRATREKVRGNRQDCKQLKKTAFAVRKVSPAHLVLNNESYCTPKTSSIRSQNGPQRTSLTQTRKSEKSSKMKTNLWTYT